jgi:membrane fusion protein
LFRPEAMAEQQTQWLGTVLLTPRISHVAFAVFALLAAVGLLSLLFFADYTRKARINGWLVPELGLMRIFAPQPGVLVRLYVREGQEVAKGAPLALLSAELQSESVGATRKEIVRNLSSRRASMEAEKERQRRLYVQQSEELGKRLEAIALERAHIDREIELQVDLVALAEKGAARQRELRAKQLSPEPRLQQAEENKLEQAVKLQTLERSRATIDRETSRLEAEYRDLPFKHQTQVAEIERAIATLDQEIAEAESRREFVIAAPADGVVTAIQAEPGGNANTTAPLLSIVPAGSKLEAQLFSPSRAVGFVRPGQQVLLRYQAFPYQKFGYYEGTVASVSRSAMSPSELPQQMSGLTSLYGANEPVYRITVALARQTAIAYGEPAPLAPGMQLEADVLIETRRLIEWVFDPLFTLTGKWRA